MSKAKKDEIVNRFITGLLGLLITVAGYFGNRTLVRIEKTQEESDARQRRILEEISSLKFADRWTRTDHDQYAKNIERDLSQLREEARKCCEK